MSSSAVPSEWFPPRSSLITRSSNVGFRTGYCDFVIPEPKVTRNQRIDASLRHAGEPKP